MGSYAPAQDHDDLNRPVTVLVTGFGPFQDRYPVNPSYEIARSLPHLLPKVGTKRKAVQIIGYGSPIRVCYDDARELVPTLLESYSGTVDLVLHMGMASGRRHYTAERYAHSNGYGKHKDLEGKVPPFTEPEDCFGDCPSLMQTSLTFDDVVKQWQTTVAAQPITSPAHGADCRPSEDAGSYLCDYTYLNSLVWYGRKNKALLGGGRNDRPVLFLHVPPESDEVSLERGRAVAVALISAMVEDYVGIEQQ